MKHAHRPQVESLEGRMLLAADVGTVAWYRFDEAGGTSAVDSSGNNNTGTLIGGPTRVAGKLGSAVSFSSTKSDVVTVNDANSLDITTNITLAAWVKPSGTGNQVILRKGKAGSTAAYELGLGSDGKAFVRFNQGTSGDTFRVNSLTSHPTKNKAWMHIAATYDGSTIRLYINGVLEASKSASFSILNSSHQLGLGAQYDAGTGLKGILDDTRIYNRVLSAGEVTELFSGQTPSNLPPVVNAGTDKSITLPTTSVNMTGSVSDDGKPAGAPVTSSWSVIAKPTGSTVTFGNAASPTSSVTFSQAGSYTLRLTASDTQLSATDDVVVTVNAEPPANVAPVVNAGADQTITLPNTASLAGSVSDDGKPAGATVTSTWSVLNKPTGSTVTFGNGNSPTTTATFSQAGTYTLQLTASDTALSASDQVIITVNPVPQQGVDPVAWFKFDGNATNSGTLGGNGTLVNNPSYVAGQSDQALQFSNSTNSRVTVADTAALDATTALTLSAWIRPSSTGTQYIIKKARSDAGNGYELGLSSTGRLFFRLNDFTNGDTFRVDSTSTYPTNGTWTHVAGVFDGSTIRIYVNGVQQGSKSANTVIGTNSYALGIGGQDNGYRSVNGTVDDARVYTRALSAAEIQALYNPTPQPTLPYAAAITFAQQQLLATLAQINNSTSTFVNRTTSTGNWNTVGASDWTSGFLPGTMWQLYQLTGDAAWQTRATNWTTPLAGQATAQTEDLYFRLMTSYGNLYQSSGSSTHRQVLLNAAASRMTQWNETVGAFETDWRDSTSGDARANYAVLMDQTSDALLVYWAGKQLNNQTYIDRAVRHVRTVMNNLVRPDGSTYQFMYFDSATGQAISGETSQGYANESTWSRGQAWAVYFLTAFARETGFADITAKARQVTDYFIANSPADGVPYWDFEHPSIPNTYRDSSAAAIAASGMLDLSGSLTDPADKAKYKAAAEKILNSLASSAYLAQGTSSKGILLHGAQNVPNLPASADVSLIFGDYYFLEAIKRYRAMS